jgi:hypothetical protein
MCFEYQSELVDEAIMIEDRTRQDIALIRSAIEQGRSYANARSPDMLVWGIAIAVGYLGTYAFVRGWSPLDPNWLWALCIGLPWLFSLRRAPRHLVEGADHGRVRSPMAKALAMLWLGCGISLTMLYIAAVWSGEIRGGWFGAVVAGVLGIGFFASAWLSNLLWLRWVALGWWLGELVVFALRHRPEVLPLSAVLMLVLLAGPGFALIMRRPAQADA